MEPEEETQPARRWLHTLRWLLGGSAIRLCTAALIWAILLILEGKSVRAALRGNVEDALGMLQGILTLGVILGAAVGLLRGLATKDAWKKPPA